MPTLGSPGEKAEVAAPPTPAEVQLALRLRQHRESLQQTQAQLAALFSIEQQVGAATISSWENMRTAASPPEARLEPYARILTVQQHRSVAPRLISAEEFSGEELATRDRILGDLKQLWDAVRGSQDYEISAGVASTYRSWFFDDDGPVTIILPDAPPEARGPLFEPQEPNHTQAHAYADIDALIELFGAIRAENEPTFPVSFRPASLVDADDLSGHVVLLGGVGWNEVTSLVLRSLTRLPVRQVTDRRVPKGEVFAVGENKDEERYLPHWSPDDDTVLVEDVGFLARVPNPFNSSRTLTLCNGIHSRGVLGSVRALTDIRLRDSNESYLAERFQTGEYAVLMRVPVVKGKALSPDLRNPYSRLYEWPEGRGASTK